jgi:hypothetical protein
MTTTYGIISMCLLLEWSLLHFVAGIVSFGPAINGKMDAFYLALMNRVNGSPREAAFRDMEAKGSALDDNGEGWPFLSNRVAIQHAMNLFFVGAECLIGAIAVYYNTRFAWLLALPAFLFDIGYFVAMDYQELGGPMGEAQTFIVSLGMIFAGLQTIDEFDDNMTQGEKVMYLLLPILFLSVAVLNKVLHIVKVLPDEPAKGSSVREL